MSFVKKIIGNAAYRKALLQHKEATALNDAGRYAEAKVKFDQALENYRTAYANGCREPYMLMAVGILELRNGNYEQARSYYLETEKQKLKPAERMRLRNNFAILQWKLGHIDEAIEQLRIAEQSGKTSFLYGTLGYLLIEKGDYAVAEQYNLEGLDYDDEDSVVLDNLGQLYLRMGRKEEARGFFQRAHERKPRQVDTLYYLAQFAIEDGDADTARDYLDRALASCFSSLCTVPREKVQALRDQLS